MPTDITKITPIDVTLEQKANTFDHIFRQLAQYRNISLLYMSLEPTMLQDKQNQSTAFDLEVNSWAQSLLTKAWVICMEEDKKKCPKLGPYADTSTVDLPPLPPKMVFEKLLTNILFLDVTISKLYSARTRAFLSKLGQLDEISIVEMLKNPEQALKQVREKADQAKEQHAQRGKILRTTGMAIGAATGGVLTSITGGLAAPLVGAGVASVLGWLGIGGSALGLLASGVASSSIVCGSLFGAYGACLTARMVERHVQEIKDLAIIPIQQGAVNDMLSVHFIQRRLTHLLYSGLEIQALEDLSNALMTLVKSQTMQYLKLEVVKCTVLASLIPSLAPLAWLKIGKIIGMSNLSKCHCQRADYMSDNPWMNAKALAEKAGAVLGDLLEKRAFGNRPVTLVGYSLGSLVIFEALRYLLSLPPNNTLHLIQDVYLFGNPASADPAMWTSIRRMVAGRLVNGYSNDDYVLAVLSRVSNASWDVPGLQAIEVKGVENVLCEGVEGHTMWRGMIGQCLEMCHAPGIVNEEVDQQVKKVPMREEMNQDNRQFDSENGGSPIAGGI
ncbi:DUF726-domain-containing protein [Cyathus striatus]|nr:DUF726-domain-containing protein [Cyathus striatus]